MTETFDIADVRFVKRVVVGNTDPSNMKDESVIQKQMDYLTRCLQENPKGWIIGKEKSFHLVRLGEHQIAMEYVAYHIGFKRKPVWMDEDPAQTQVSEMDSLLQQLIK
ncbi:hypothetical protein EV586_1254 [Tumebacillus sp. BK434]|uniref:hypothetical protein n=1 Tax=Tumebacillus sp. BK434 TaxID=2512169 RepID=UPI00104BDFF4|nr:hypothetical protein [Tumebacillus sp. BK434]TCP49425.1 hypothetical protein EV586_1254 [Tumebacillus sp. BK434]